MKRSGLLVIICFMIITVAILYGYASNPQMEWSFSENRELAQRPLAANYRGEPDAYMKAFESYLSDQFPLREKLVNVYTSFQKDTGRWYVRGLRVMQDEPPSTDSQGGNGQAAPYYIGSDYLFQDSYRVSVASQETFRRALVMLCGIEGATVVDIPLPHKNYALSEGTAGQISSTIDSDNLEFRRDAAAEAGAVFIDCCKPMIELFDIEERAEMYYKTDTHWNDLGAYRCCEIIADLFAKEGIIEQGSIPRTDAFVWKQLGEEHLYDGDIGRMISEKPGFNESIPVYLIDNSDQIRYYKSPEYDYVPRSAVVATDLESELIDYNMLSTKNLLYLRVENPDAPEKRSVLIIKDSYQCPTVDYLTAIFSEINIVDPRYELPTIGQLVEERGIDLVLIMFHQNNRMQEFSDYVFNSVSGD